MHQPTAYTRREFLGTSLSIVSTTAMVPLFVHQSAFALAPPQGALTASQPGVPEDRVLLIIELAGGNDGLNTIVPYGASEYHDARPVLAVRDKDVIKLDEQRGIGLHPQMQPIREMIDDGTAAIIQGVGYPNPNRSHFTSRDIWHTADPAGHGTGWIGRTMDRTVDPKTSEGTDCVCIGSNVPLATQGQTFRPISFESPKLFRWNGSKMGKDLARRYDQINRTPAADGPDGNGVNEQIAFLMRTSLDAQVASERIRRAVDMRPATSFPRNPLANQLRMVAAMIRAEIRTRVYYVRLGGFDTHASQAPTHAYNLRVFSESVHAFQKELKATGHDGRVLTITFSEFGRRVRQNASNGTDHGTAGPMFVFGNMVGVDSKNHGLIGAHPSLSHLDQGDLIHHTDFRSVYGTVLDQWLKTDSATILGRRFKPLNMLSAAAVS